MTNSVDPDQMASGEWPLFAKVGVVVNSRIRVKKVEMLVGLNPSPAEPGYALLLKTV